MKCIFGHAFVVIHYFMVSIGTTSSITIVEKMKNILSVGAISLCYYYYSFSTSTSWLPSIVGVYADKPISRTKHPLTSSEEGTTGATETTTTTTTKEVKPSSSFYFVHKSVIIPDDRKKHRGGEDAISTSDQWLVGKSNGSSNPKDTSSVDRTIANRTIFHMDAEPLVFTHQHLMYPYWFGRFYKVADGVGGWASQNVNPGLYSRLLTKQVVEIGTKIPTATLQEIVHAANWKAADKHLGSATCTTIKLTGPNQITTLNVGDSGYSIHRKEKNKLVLIFESVAGQKRFNFPHQLGGEYGDQVKDVAVEMTHTLEPNDIIVVYSDGVSDNLFPQQFHECLTNAMGDNDDNDHTIQSFSLAADCIARTAYFLGKNKQFDSPFAQGARKAGWGEYRGGKHDDISVVVAQISTIPTTPSSSSAAAAMIHDPYLEESIFLYTGKVGAVKDLPTLASLMKSTTAGDDGEL